MSTTPKSLSASDDSRAWEVMLSILDLLAEYGRKQSVDENDNRQKPGQSEVEDEQLGSGE